MADTPRSHQLPFDPSIPTVLSGALIVPLPSPVVCLVLLACRSFLLLGCVRGEQLRQSAYVRGEQLRQSAYVRGEQLRQSAYVRGEQLRQNAYVRGEQLRQSAYVRGAWCVHDVLFFFSSLLRPCSICVFIPISTHSSKKWGRGDLDLPHSPGRSICSYQITIHPQSRSCAYCPPPWPLRYIHTHRR
jgi:hypothetical protein